ncbi:hypothetical protein J6590_027242, partial [Homalodisca vitripennis]
MCRTLLLLCDLSCHMLFSATNPLLAELLLLTELLLLHELLLLLLNNLLLLLLLLLLNNLLFLLRLPLHCLSFESHTELNHYHFENVQTSKNVYFTANMITTVQVIIVEKPQTYIYTTSIEYGVWAKNEKLGDLGATEAAALRGEWGGLPKIHRAERVTTPPPHAQRRALPRVGHMIQSADLGL